MVFFGLNDSWEGYYQSIRRCWRFGQASEVVVDIVISNVEFEIYENVMRKENLAVDMSKELIEHVSLYEREELQEVLNEAEVEFEAIDAAGLVEEEAVSDGNADGLELVSTQMLRVVLGPDGEKQIFTEEPDDSGFDPYDNG